MAYSVTKIIDLLNEAFEADPAAIQALIQNHVPCNVKLADHPTIQVGVVPTLKEESFSIGALGLINGIIEILTGERVAVMFDDPDENGVSRIIGFTKYKK